MASREAMRGVRSGAGRRDEQMIAAFARAIEAHDRRTAEHSRSVARLGTAVARAMGLSAGEVERVRLAALLHDVGKLGVSEEVLRKPGPLNEREREAVRKHSANGEGLLAKIGGLGEVARIVRHVHERWDGRGYPDRLAGERIPAGSRIVSACDAYDAMTGERPYRRALSEREAIVELAHCAGSQFDPEVVRWLCAPGARLAGARRGGGDADRVGRCIEMSLKGGGEIADKRGERF